MHHGVTFNFGSAKVYSLAIFETSFSYDKYIWIAATDYYMYSYIIVLFPLTAKGIIGRDLKFAGYVPHYKILTGNIFGLILKNKMATTGVSLSVMKSAFISLIIGPRGLGW